MAKAPSSGIDPELVRELAAILRETDLTEIEVESQSGDLKLRLARQTQIVAAAPVATYAPAPAAVAPSAAPTAAPAPAVNAGDADRANPGMVPSPIVGTVYLAPEPGAATFVSIGTQVTEGQTIMIVEAMKTMNPISAPRAGKVTKICVSDAQPVEYGEPLVIIE